MGHPVTLSTLAEQKYAGLSTKEQAFAWEMLRAIEDNPLIGKKAPFPFAPIGYIYEAGQTNMLLGERKDFRIHYIPGNSIEPQVLVFDIIITPPNRAR